LRDGPERLFWLRPRERFELWFCLMTSIFFKIEACPASHTNWMEWPF
jgi:hypothetical protein